MQEQPLFSCHAHSGGINYIDSLNLFPLVNQALSLSVVTQSTLLCSSSESLSNKQEQQGALYLLASAADDQCIKLWLYRQANETTYSILTCVHTIEKAHDGDVECARFFIHNKVLYVVSCAYDITCKIWKLNGCITCGDDNEAQDIDLSHELVTTLTGHTRPVWTHDMVEHNGTMVVVTGAVDNNLQYYSNALEKSTPDTVMVGHKKAVRCVRFATNTTDQLTCISGSYDMKLLEWNVLDGTCIRVFDSCLHKATITLLHMELDRNILFTGSFDSKVRCIEYDSGNLLQTYSGCNPIFGLSITDKYIGFGGSNRTWYMFDRTDDKQLCAIKLSDLSHRINAAVLLPMDTVVFAHGSTISILKIREETNTQHVE